MDVFEESPQAGAQAGHARADTGRQWVVAGAVVLALAALVGASTTLVALTPPVPRVASDMAQQAGGARLIDCTRGVATYLPEGTLSMPGFGERPGLPVDMELSADVVRDASFLAGSPVENPQTVALTGELEVHQRFALVVLTRAVQIGGDLPQGVADHVAIPLGPRGARELDATEAQSAERYGAPIRYGSAGLPAGAQQVLVIAEVDCTDVPEALAG